MGAFYSTLPVKEYKFLMNGETELTYDDLYSLLKNNEVSNFDPVAEAFSVIQTICRRLLLLFVNSVTNELIGANFSLS